MHQVRSCGLWCTVDLLRRGTGARGEPVPPAPSPIFSENTSLETARPCPTALAQPQSRRNHSVRQTWPSCEVAAPSSVALSTRTWRDHTWRASLTVAVCNRLRPRNADGAELAKKTAQMCGGVAEFRSAMDCMASTARSWAMRQPH